MQIIQQLKRFGNLVGESTRRKQLRLVDRIPISPSWSAVVIESAEERFVLALHKEQCIVLSKRPCQETAPDSPQETTCL